MSGASFVLPPLVLFSDYGGDWNAYLDAVYACFRRDFIDSKPVFQGQRLGLKHHPMTCDKEATFWHMIQEGVVESERTPDLRRCERIRWPRPVIESADSPLVRVWHNERRGEPRICLWCTQENYLVVLAVRKNYILLWTAYLVEAPHRQRKLQSEYEEYCRKQARKG